MELEIGNWNGNGVRNKIGNGNGIGNGNEVRNEIGNGNGNGIGVRNGNVIFLIFWYEILIWKLNCFIKFSFCLSFV